MSKKWVYLCLAAVVFLTGLIFFNSAKDTTDSYADSERLEELFLHKTDIDITFELDYTVRKVAHLLEFSLLGVVVSLLVRQVSRLYHRHLWGFACFYLLAVGVLDEFIQHFSGRSSLVSDVLLDFVGAMLGFAIAFGVCRFVVYRRAKRNPCGKVS